MKRIHTGTPGPIQPDMAGRLSSPSSRRNVGPILAILQEFLPPRGHLLELASGSGEHCATLAAAFPQLRWTPSDVVPERLASIRAWIADAGLKNVDDPIELDVEAAEWPFDDGAVDAILVANLLHLVPEWTMAALFKNVARVLPPGCKLFIYGPFTRDGQFVSEGDASFHESLRSQDEAIGYKDIRQVEQLAAQHDITVTAWRDMPANNLTFVGERSLISS
jgi:cyclopropane fatty-acyl-phospholipid synthase-like methyltransferase